MSLLNELKRRNVLGVTAAYLVVGWLLTEVLTTILPTLGAPDWTSRAVILVFVLGFIPTIVLSWIYQLTPDGIKRDSAMGSAPARSRAFDYLVIASVVGLVFVLAVLGSVSEDGNSRSGAGVNTASIAVLPFINMSGDEDNEYFSDGLTETLLHMLAQIPDLQVAARTSSFAFKGQNLDVRDIAETLQVAHILEGSVQRSGDKVRITAQLIRAADGFHVWSSNFDRTIDDIFAIQDEIAAEVGDALSVSILGTAAPIAPVNAGTRDAEAYDLYLQAGSAAAGNSYRGLQAAESLLKGALAIDPNYLDAKTQLANVYLHQWETGLIDAALANPQIIALSNQVLASEPDNAGARAIQLYVQTISSLFAGRPDVLPNAISQFEELLGRDPSDYSIRSQLSRLLRLSGQTERAIEVQMEALAKDALNSRVHFELGSAYLAQGKLDDARKALERSLELQDDQPNAYIQLSALSLLEGDGRDYVQQQLQAFNIDPQDHEIPAFIAIFLYRLGLLDEGDDFSAIVEATAPTSEAAYRIELTRGMATGDEVATIASAKRAIVDDIEDRQFAYGAAVQQLLRAAANNGTLEAAFAWLEETAPGLLDIDDANAPSKALVARIVAIDAWYLTVDAEELSRRISLLQAAAAGFGMNPFEDPKMQIKLLAMRGDTEAAIELALAEVFSESVLNHPHWKQSFSLPQFAAMRADPRIQDAMQSWSDEEAAQADSVRTFLAELSKS